MQNLSEHLATLWNNAKANLCDVINLHGKKSRFMEAQCIAIDNPQLQRLLDGGRALVEITPTILLDEGGYQYNHDVLNSEQFMQLVDYLVEKYKVYEGETEPEQDAALELIQSIDFKALKEQRSDILQSIDDFKYEAKAANEAGEEKLAARYQKQIGSLNGVLHLLDSLADFAVDEMGKDEKDVMLTENDK